MFCKNVALNGTFNLNFFLHKYYITGHAACGTNTMTDNENQQIFLGSNHSLYPSTLVQKYYFQREQCYDTSQNIYAHIPAFVYLVCFLQPKYTEVGSFSWYYFPSSSLLWIVLLSVSLLIWTLTECFPVHFKYFCKFLIKILQSDIFTVIFQLLLSFLKKWSQCLWYTISL